jgi:hypothetical protein
MMSKLTEGTYALGALTALCVWLFVGLPLIQRNSGANMELKDILTLIVSLAALITSIAVAWSNWWSRSRQLAEDAKKDFSEAIMEIAKVRQDHEELRKDAGEEYDHIKFEPRRVVLADRRTFYLSKALQVLTQKQIVVSSFEYLLLAAALIDSARVGDSVEYYQKAYDLAENEHTKASAQRVYGRALIAMGDYGKGRAEMLSAADRFKKLSENERYDRDRMLGEAAETYHRLVIAEIRKMQIGDVEADIDTFRELTKKLQDPSRRNVMTSGVEEVEQMLRAGKERPRLWWHGFPVEDDSELIRMPVRTLYDKPAELLYRAFKATSGKSSSKLLVYHHRSQKFLEEASTLRDQKIEDNDIIVLFSPESLDWRNLGVEQTDEQGFWLSMLTQTLDLPLGVPEILASRAGSKVKVSDVRRRLSELGGTA